MTKSYMLYSVACRHSRLSSPMEMAEYIVSKKTNRDLLTMDTYLDSTSIVRRTLL